MLGNFVPVDPGSELFRVLRAAGIRKRGISQITARLTVFWNVESARNLVLLPAANYAAKNFEKSTARRF